MKRAQMLALLNKWQERMQDAEAKMGELTLLVGSNPEAPFQSAVYALMGGYTRSLAESCGFAAEWLEAWWLEHNFGERPMQAGLVGEPDRELRTLDDLLALIVDDIAAADAYAAEETD